MISIKRILAPVDFSETSKKAVAYSLAFAAKFNARVIIAHIVPESAALAYAFPAETFTIEKEQCKTAQREIHNLTLLDEAAGLDLQATVKIGSVENELLGIVRNESVDLVVMGTHGRRYLGRWFIGSVTEHLLRKLPVPVLTVSHVESGPYPRGLVSLKRILYATNLCESSSAGLKYAVNLARRYGAQLTVMHVIEDWDRIMGGPALLMDLETERARLLQELGKTVDHLLTQESMQGLAIETAILDGKPFEKILETAEDRGIDIIVLNLQSKPMLERAFLGSTAERVVRLAKVPVLSIPVSSAL